MLELYQKEGCPYCQKVRYRMTELDLDYICRNVSGSGSAKAEILTKLGGMVQVPYLVDTDKNVAMYESDDIIKYLEENYS
jgi:glutathione S-transferase